MMRKTWLRDRLPGFLGLRDGPHGQPGPALRACGPGLWWAEVAGARFRAGGRARRGAAQGRICVGCVPPTTARSSKRISSPQAAQSARVCRTAPHRCWNSAVALPSRQYVSPHSLRAASTGSRARPASVRTYHPDLEQELQRIRSGLRRRGPRHRHPGPAPPPLRGRPDQRPWIPRHRHRLRIRHRLTDPAGTTRFEHCRTRPPARPSHTSE